MQEGNRQNEKLLKLQERLRQAETTISRQKIWLKDRKAFLKFCKCIGITDCELIFESANAKDAPIDLDELLLGAAHVIDARKTETSFQEFVELTLGEPVPGRLNIHTLRQKWVAKQEEKSGESASNLVLSTIHEKIKKQAERIEELENDILKFSNNSSKEAKSTSTETESAERRAASSQTGEVKDQSEKIADLTNKLVESQSQMREMDKERQSTIEYLETELSAMRKRCVEAEDRLSILESERNKFNFVEALAAKQAERDATIALLNAEIHALKNNNDTKSDDSNERRVLSSHIFIKFVAYAILNDFTKMRALIPIARELFQFSEADADELFQLCNNESPTTINSWLPSFS